MSRTVSLSLCTAMTVLLAGCAAANRGGSTGAEGTDCEHLVAVSATSESEGVAAEHQWLASRYPGGRIVGQRLINCSDRPVDLIEVETARGEVKTVYFDISGWFGQY